MRIRAPQLETLGGETAGEGAERRELRDLVRHQLEVVRRARGRREALAQKRAHLFDLMRGLWTRVRGVAEALPTDIGVVAEAAERVRSLCGEIAAQLEPATERSASAPASRPTVPS